jgi:hypothetical protein
MPRRLVRLPPKTLRDRGHHFSSAMCRYCCKSPKLPAANFSAVKKSDQRPPVDVASITLPRPPASLSSGDEVPHIFTRKSRVQPKEILITSAKRLLQQNLPIADPCNAANILFLRLSGWLRGITVREMKEGPLRPAVRFWPQTAASCRRQSDGGERSGKVGTSEQFCSETAERAC